MPGRDCQELVNPLLESGGGPVATAGHEEKTRMVFHAHGFGPSELSIDLNGIERSPLATSRAG